MHSSNELHQVMSDAMLMYHEISADLQEQKIGWKLNADGSYDEWMDNKVAMKIFGELYKMAKDVRKLAESPMAKNHQRLERLTIRDPSFKKMASHFMDDIHAHSMPELIQRFQELA